LIRSLEDLANATPTDYLSHSPSNPDAVAYKLLSQVSQRTLEKDRGLEISSDSRQFLYVGPGSGLVISTVIQEGQLCYGLETSRRGIASAPDSFRNYILWQKPWETTFGKKQFDITILSTYLHELLTPEEWELTVTEMKRISKTLLKYAS